MRLVGSVLACALAMLASQAVYAYLRGFIGAAIADIQRWRALRAHRRWLQQGVEKNFRDWVAQDPEHRSHLPCPKVVVE
jgi:hypothetical protein